MPDRAVETFLESRWHPGIRRLVLACSGGADSVALLHILSGLPRRQTDLLVVHVHHGLHADADRWLAQVEALARHYRAAFCGLKVQVPPEGGVENAARTARYRAIAGVLRPGDVLLTAHHQNDQAETVLLRLLRGSGATGLGGMRAASPVPCTPGDWPLWRPLLTVSRDELMQYAQQQRLDWVEDSANRDVRHARNFLRGHVLPLMQTRWPQAVAQLTDTAQRMQETDCLLRELAALDLVRAAAADGALQLPPLLALTPPRQRNLLRHWLQEQHLPSPDRAALQRMVSEVGQARCDAEPRFQWGTLEVRRYRDRLYAMPVQAEWPVTAPMAWPDRTQPVALPDGRCLTVQAVTGEGLCPDAWRQARRIAIRFRQGGESLRLAGRPGDRPLKDLFQAAGIPPWRRAHWPLLYLDEELAVVPGIGVSAHVRVPSAGLQIAIT